MSFSGTYEDEYGLPDDAGRNLYSSDGSSLVEVRESEYKFLSSGKTYSLTNSDSNGSLTVEIIFKGKDIDFKFIYTYNGGTVSETYSNVFSSSLIWLDEDSSEKNTPKGTTEEPETMGNFSKNAHFLGETLVFNTMDGTKYILKGSTLSEESSVNTDYNEFNKVFTYDKATAYLSGKATEYASENGKPPY